ncbi:MAG: heme ABC exporter ATP-binding protein CcmA [Gammaproteobacteria bacterium]
MISYLKVENLTLSVYPRCILKAISFELSTGDSLALIGSNGIGKSTLLRTLADLRSVEKGQINWTGGVKAYLGHLPGFRSLLSPLENLSEVQLYAGYHPDRTQSEHYLKKVGLPKNAWTKRCAELSQGQCRRVALAQVLAKRANLWLLDEPCAALDTSGRDLFLRLLSEHLEMGGVAIVTGHQPLSFCAQQLDLESYAAP